MQLTQHTDFGLRLLIVLARSGGGPVSLFKFATDQGLSYNHIMKVAQALGHADFVVSRRGRRGGVFLARSAEEISVGDVVRSMEPNLRLADCGNCALRFDCGASGVLAKALAAFFAVLDQTTLAEAARSGNVAAAPWLAPSGQAACTPSSAGPPISRKRRSQ